MEYIATYLLLVAAGAVIIAVSEVMFYLLDKKTYDDFTWED